MMDPVWIPSSHRAVPDDSRTSGLRVTVGGGGAAQPGTMERFSGFRGPVLEICLPTIHGAASWTELPANPLIGYHADRPLSEMTREEFAFYCDSCQRGFFSQRKLDEHMAEHLWCTAEGCRFTTRHQWKLELHMETLHNRPDAPDLRDTAGYLEQRRNRFPTREAVAEKVEELFYKSARGELLPDERRRWLRQHGVHVRRPQQDFVYVPIVNRDEEGDEAGGGRRPVHPRDAAAAATRDGPVPQSARKEKMLPKGVDGRFTRAQQVQMVRDKYREAKHVPRFYVCTRCGEKGAHWVTSCPTIGDEKFDRHVTWAEDRTRGGVLGKPPRAAMPKQQPPTSGPAAEPAAVDAVGERDDGVTHAEVARADADGNVAVASPPQSGSPERSPEKGPPAPIREADGDDNVIVEKSAREVPENYTCEVKDPITAAPKGDPETSAPTKHDLPDESPLQPLHVAPPCIPPTMRRFVPRRRVLLPPREPSLFDKLVEDERLDDKGLLLQAFRYFVRTNFLQPSSSAESASESTGKSPRRASPNSP